MSEYTLSQKIIELSRSKHWHEAKLEWILEDIYISDEPGTCLCGHFPIIEMCILRNKITHHTTIVGNYCVNKFIGLPSDIIFQAAKRVQKDPVKSFNVETINHAINKGWVNGWERDFYFNILRKRKLSANQLGKKIEINQKVLRFMARENG